MRISDWSSDVCSSDLLTDIKIKAGTIGLLIIGGGVPKNFAQDTVVCADILGHDDVEVHKYAVQITVADVRDVACSSSTLQSSEEHTSELSHSCALRMPSSAGKNKQQQQSTHLCTP